MKSPSQLNPFEMLKNIDQAPYVPVFEVRDTLHKYGRYDPQTKTITVSDLIKFHGHLCGGLMEAAMALRAAFDALFPAGVIDRTDLTIISNNSACGGDVAAYLTGARARFGSHIIDLSLSGGEFIVRRVSTGDTVHVSLRPEVHPHEVKAQMRKLLGGDYSPEDIDLFGRLQWDYARRLVQHPASESFTVEHLHDFVWPDPTCLDLGRRSDNDFKDAP
ncbi:MAG TPA: hypothetical protein G4N94_07570 [Caldilineae bacterium]|nr:hypothetical protein [Caldilineae bacterium]